MKIEELIQENRILTRKNERLSRSLEKDAVLKLEIKCIISDLEHEIKSGKDFNLEMACEYLDRILDLNEKVK